jgi:hypothetical protein
VEKEYAFAFLKPQLEPQDMPTTWMSIDPAEKNDFDVNLAEYQFNVNRAKLEVLRAFFFF